ncbi:DEAD/DEAH box helicase [Litorihabitans aurantiacus]|uniref:Helicase n=1 Tax=Litorihabitans aurantiacus TaxID=1930061 RepID=A0AA37UVS9_9MICO|nr:DEAD/DEAH box helicase [Litorihabitans aurantiacus]GMA31272.1 helicase [Litorihabitans aurantiacus]
MSSPAERYAASRRRAKQTSAMGPLAQALEDFERSLDFPLDDFQSESCRHLASGQDVLVAAPTGAGKTVVGECAVHLALASGRKAFYTTPIKALSNQKYLDLARVHGADRVGLLTGDVSVNADAPVVVMTTEVLRNMIYAGSSALTDLGYVVMDEVHYLADAFRGPVWEEVILLLVPTVRLVSLSATVSNAEEFGQWLTAVRGTTAVVVSEHRPVPLWQHMMVRSEVVDLYTTRSDGTDPAGAVLNPDLVEAVRRAERSAVGPGDGDGGGHGGRGSRGSAAHRGRGRGGRPDRGGHGSPRGRSDRAGGVRPPRRDTVIERLDVAALLPAIVFVFSRAGCEAAVDQVLASGIRLTTQAEQREIGEILEQTSVRIPAEDLDAVGFSSFAAAAMRGVAAHHAGLLPVFKEAVEALFGAGLVKVVFATETLALGVNMPARSVVVERLVKWDGREHAALTPGEYTQLTGRAGRRGIDVEGHAVVLYASGVDPNAVAGLASRRTYPLRSRFTPTYNMAVNLLTTAPYGRVRDILEQSFAQFQADRSVVGLARQLRKHEDALAGYRESMACDRGDIGAYLDLQRRLSDVEADGQRQRSQARRRAAAESLAGLRTGDVLEIARGRRSAWVVVVDPGTPGFDGPQPQVLGEERQVRTLTAHDAPHGVSVVGRVKVPRAFTARDAQARRDLASSLRNALAAGFSGKAAPRADAAGAATAPGTTDDIARLRAALRAHPCHGCPEREDHLRWARRAEGLQADHDRLSARIASRTASIARDFDRVCEVLLELGYLERDDDAPEPNAGPESAPATHVTASGRWLRRIYAERDLVLAQCLASGAWDQLDAAELAAVATTIVYSSRGDDDGGPRAVPGVSSRLTQALEATTRIAAQVDALEREAGLTPAPPVDTGFVRLAHRWARGESLGDVLSHGDLAAGDFVRWCKQVLDVLDQMAGAAPSPTLRRHAREAMDLVRRGVVAQELV